MSRLIWLLGAAGIGKTHWGSQVAADLDVDFFQLDELRAVGWSSAISSQSFVGTRFEQCRDYIDARSSALDNIDDFIRLYTLLGRHMLAELWRSPKYQRAGVKIVECSSVYSLALPDYGIRVRAFIDRGYHRQLLRQALHLTQSSAEALCNFLVATEASALSATFVHYQVPMHAIGEFLRDIVKRKWNPC